MYILIVFSKKTPPLQVRYLYVSLMQGVNYQRACLLVIARATIHLTQTSYFSPENTNSQPQAVPRTRTVEQFAKNSHAM